MICNFVNIHGVLVLQLNKNARQMRFRTSYDSLPSSVLQQSYFYFAKHGFIGHLTHFKLGAIVKHTYRAIIIPLTLFRFELILFS
jgi:hypothetical protein